MKILSVRFKNITSLRGEHTISFNQSPFTESGLFAITGPTGAGKSSILDAITLALYGCAPRFNRESPLEIMSYYTADCLAEVEFEAQGKVYRSKWTIHRSRGKLEGEIQPPRMELVDVAADVILTAKKTEVVEKVSELTGLDYFRFLRSVMLAQGDFARFLHADKNEKGELLEKITGTDIYTRISRRAFERQKEHRLRLEQLESQLDTSRVLSAEQQADFRQQQAENSRTSALLEADIQTHTQYLQWRQTLEQLRGKAAALQTEWKAILAQQEKHQPDFERLARHQRAVPFRPARREVELLDERMQLLSSEITQLQGTLPALEHERNAAQQGVNEAQTQLLSAKREQEQSLPVIERVSELHTELQLLRDQFKRIKSNTDSICGDIHQYQTGKAAIAASLEAQRKTYADIKQYLEEHAADICLDKDISLIEQQLKDLQEIAQAIAGKEAESRQAASQQENLGEKISSLETEIRRQQSQVKWIEMQIKELQTESTNLMNGLSLDELDNLLDKLNRQYIARTNQKKFSATYLDKAETIDLLQKELQDSEQTVMSLQAQLSQVQEREQQAQQQLLLLQRLCETENLILNYESARNKLRPGEPCPLCGSPDHPYVSQHYQVRLSETEQQRDLQQRTLEHLRDQRETIHRSINQLEANRNNSLKTLHIFSQEVSTLEKEFQSHNQQLGEHNSIRQLTVLEEKLTGNSEEQQRLQTLRKQLRDKAHRLEQYKDQREKNQQLLREQEVQASEARMQKDLTDEKLKQLREELEKMRQQKTQKEQALTQVLRTYQLQIPATTEHTAWVGSIRQRISTYRDYEVQEKKTDQEIARLNAETEKLDSLIEKLQESARKLLAEKETLEAHGKALSAQVKELFGDKHPQTEKERLATAIEQCELQLRRLEKILNDKTELLALRRQQTADKQHQLETTRTEYYRQETALVAQLQQAGFTDLNQYQSCLLDTATETAIRQQQEQLNRQLVSIQGAIAQTEKDRHEQEARKLTDADIPAITQVLTTLRGEKEQIIARNAQIEQILQENEALLQKHQALVQDIGKQRWEYDRWHTLSRMIGSATGAEFNIFAQGLTLANLVQLANFHLEKLNPRYSIRRKPHTDLELEIVDRYQADNVRTMKTLSGGETFLVSLSLALGLSDLAGNKTRIDSLFIDEGFGTLDPDTLDLAITTLENLQASGKTIGIISHVDALKERITTQIQVTKMSGGVSALKVVG